MIYRQDQGVGVSYLAQAATQKQDTPIGKTYTPNLEATLPLSLATVYTVKITHVGHYAHWGPILQA